MKRTKTIRKLPSVIEEIEFFLAKHHVTTVDIQCCRLLAEEIVYVYREKQGCDRFSFEITKKADKATVTLAFRCGSLDVLADEDDIIIRNIKNLLADNCTWEYRNGKNIIRFTLQAGRSLAQNLLFLTKFIKGEKSRITAACSLQLLGIVLSVVIPILTAHLISNFALNDITAILITAATLFLVHAVNDLVVYFANRLHNAAYDKIRYSIEMELANSIMNMQIGTIDKHGTGMIIQRMTGDTVSLASGVESLVNRTFAFVRYVGVLAAIFILSPAAFAIKLASIALLIFIQSRKSKAQIHNERAYRIQNDLFADVVGEMVHGNKDIKLLNSEKAFVEKLEGVITETNRRHLHLWNTSQNFTVFSNETSNITELCFYLVVALYLSAGRILPTDAIVLFNYSLNLIGVSTFIGDFLGYIKSMGLSSERVYQLVNNREFAKEDFGEKHMDTFTGDIEFRDVTFSYNTNDPLQKPIKVLDGLDLKIRAGETVAFVGKSGCGKTTALNLIAKLYEPTAGTVLLDGEDICGLDKDTIRGNITVVSQNPYVFNMSVRDNLRLIKPDLTDEEMISVCRDVSIHDEIMQFPKGYDTIVGEGGVMISGGQRQRLALARSLLKANHIVLLDEATSALDNLTQAHIQQTIDRIKGKKTVVIVAHRLSTIKVCDRIYYFSDGKVLASGNHDQLMETCPEYRALYLSE